MVGAWYAFTGWLPRAPETTQKELGAIETAVAGLVALILAFSFSMASERFELREDVLVREANAIETTYLRCNFLVASETDACRKTLAQYAAIRAQLYGFGADRARLQEGVKKSEALQEALWAIVTRSQRERDTPAQALTISALNELIDLHTERVAAWRRIVPQEVTIVTLSLCVAWSAFAGYAFGLARNRQLVSWVGLAALASLVTLVSLDLDRPGRGFIRPARGQASLEELAQRLARKHDVERERWRRTIPERGLARRNRVKVAVRCARPRGARPRRRPCSFGALRSVHEDRRNYR